MTRPIMPLRCLACHVLWAWAVIPLQAADVPLLRSAKSGPWSALATWEGGKLPGSNTRVQVREGHTVIYDLKTDQVIRSIHVGGILNFAVDRDTQLNVGLIKIQPGDDASENGFDCAAHLGDADAAKPRPALEIGTREQSLPAKYTALIRLTYVDGMDKETCPAMVCCGGRMDLHGAPMNRTWVKLGEAAKKGDRAITLTDTVTGWRVGDRVVLTATTRQIKARKTFQPSVRDNTQAEERTIQVITGTKLTLDQPLQFDHQASGAYRGEVANLSRNVVIESADLKQRGHTMYHRGSAGAISYAEFRHLGKEGLLAKYSLHFHLCGDTMRGSYVLGASIWDSHNRWLTIHGTNYMIVRDCVGYQSKGHGFFLEDGTEVYNVLDRNLAIQAYSTKPLPRQVVPFDKNDGSGFWWANCQNTFTRNVACECDEYGYFFQAAKTPAFDPVLSIQQPDGSHKKVDIRTLPFVRFEDNEAHCQRRHSLNLGGGAPFGEPTVNGVGPDERHPFVLRNTRIWNVHWAFHPAAPSVLVDQMDIHNAEYAVWRPIYKQHAYRTLTLDQITVAKEFSPNGQPPKESDYPRPLDPVDDLPPITVITHIATAGGKLVVRGTTSDNGNVKKVLVNGREARAVRDNFAEWEVTLEAVQPSQHKLTALAEDAGGNIEKRAHGITVKLPQ